jgi:protease-4
MSFRPLHTLGRGFVLFWRALDGTRRAVLNLFMLVIILAILYGLFSGGVKPLAEKTTLVLDLQGQLVEQHAGSVREALLSNVRGDSKKTVQLRDVLTTLDAAGKDKDIGTVLLLLDDMDGSGLAMLREVAAAIDRLRATGKHVVAWGASYNQRQYMVAAHADEVYMHPMGSVMLEGFGHYRNYYHDALDKVGVTVNLLRVGTYKSFGEPYIANGPSTAAAEAESYLYNALWSEYTGEVEKARKLPQGQLMKDINDLPAQVAAVDGDMAKLALQEKLVDGLKTRDELRTMLIARGASENGGKSLRQVAFDDYLARQHPAVFGDAVGVVVAEGEISDGIESPGAIGGQSTAALIRQAREDDNIKALVLRIDSPGGSAFGSELIRREMELTRAAGKPVVVSMGDVAASGGYWISMAADEVIADPTTITGSIGVFAILPTADKVIDKLGIHTGGTTTTWLGDAGNPLRPLDPRFAQVIQGSINHVYAEFTTRAAQARKTTPEKINAVAQGRVWTGAQAKDRGLVDKLGSYGDALASAARRGGLRGAYRVAYIERENSKFDRLIDMLGLSEAQSRLQSTLLSFGLGGQLRLGLATTGLPPAAAADIVGDLSWLAEMNREHKPFMALTHCMCESP